MAIADLLKEEFAQPPPTQALAKVAGLSVGRLTHLFTREMGLSIRRYSQWLRMRAVPFYLAHERLMRLEQRWWHCRLATRAGRANMLIFQASNHRRRRRCRHSLGHTITQS